MPLHKIGIRREDINKWERRAPLIPSHVRELVRDHGLEVYIQPSNIRVFPDADYALEGARVQEDICPSRTVFAIKEIPIESLAKDKVYVFFSHTAKGQPHNMPMLKRMMELGCSIIDYEKIVNEKGQRILFFGSYAGQAGMIDSLWALGRRLKLEGIETPFLRLEQTVRYKSLVEAKEEVAEVGRLIHKKGLPSRSGPVRLRIPGLRPRLPGRPGDLRPHPQRHGLRPRTLPGLFRKSGPPARGLYKVVFKEEDMVRPAAPGGVFDLQDYYREPGKYVPVVESYLPYLNLIINGIYWTPKFPKYITKTVLARLYGGGIPPRLKVIGDITCDIDGSVECTVQATDSEEPVYVYDPGEGCRPDGHRGQRPGRHGGLQPARRAAARVLGLLQRRPQEVRPGHRRGGFPGARSSECELPPEVRKAVILYRGELTPDYRYLSGYLA